MRRSPSSLLPSPKLFTLICCVLIFSALSFAAAADRISGPVVSGKAVRLRARSLWKHGWELMKAWLILR